MIFSLIIIALTLVVGYVCLIRGFFSSLIHLACVIAGGAIAFALWEPLAHLMLDKLPQAGFFGFLSDASWALGLAIPFALSVALLRVITDKLLPANVIVDDVFNYVGGGICGLGAGVITTGILVMSVGALRIPAEFLGYKPIWYTEQAVGRGNMERLSSLWLPTDRITGWLYSNLSVGTFSSPEPLAKWYPDLDLVGPSMRITFGETKLGESRNTLRKQDAVVNGWYVIGDPDTGSQLTTVLADSWNEAAQRVIDLDGEAMSSGYIAGFPVTFRSGAKEKSNGQVIMGNGQVRLVAETRDGEHRTYHPAAVISHVRESSADMYSRFRYDGQRVFIASVGGTSDVKMVFEFAMHPGDRPLALYLRNVRYAIPGEPGNYSSPRQRDAAISSQDIFAGAGGFDVDEIDWSDAVTIGAADRGRDGALRPSNALPTRPIQKGQHRGIQIDDELFIVGGTASFAPNEMAQRTVTDSLKINKFITTSDTVVCQLAVGPGMEASLLSRAGQMAPADEPPMLVDDNGQVYEAVGYVLESQNEVRIRFEPGDPILSTNDMPQPSRSLPDQRITLIFRCNRGVNITGFTIGTKGIARFDPPVSLDIRQR
jgi:hypothetical protein